MKKQAAVSIDQGIGKVESQATAQAMSPQKTMTDFQPVKGKRRRHGTGNIRQNSANCWIGQFSVIWPDGVKRTRYVSAKTEEECEERLAELIVEMKAEVAAEKERLRGESRVS